MANILPSSRPQIRRSEIDWVVEQVDSGYAAVFIGIRGYYLDSMGRKGVNDRGLYDDAIIVYSPYAFEAFNANTDPSIVREGIATLCLGVHLYKKGNHGISRPGGGYPAYRPATKNEELPVTRDGVTYPRPGVAINIHKGGYNSTSSEGCQTLYPDQWNYFKALGDGEMDRYKQKIVPYILCENRKGKLVL